MREQQSLKLKSRSKSGVNLKSLCKHPLIAFLLTALCFAIMTVISRKYPFGKYTTVISDLEALRQRHRRILVPSWRRQELHGHLRILPCKPP